MKIILSLAVFIFFTGMASLMGQTTGQTSFAWVPNPVEVLGSPNTNVSVLSGNVMRLGQNAPILAGIQSMDTVWTRVYYSNTYSLVTLEARNAAPNRLTLTGWAVDTADTKGFVIQIDSTTLQPTLSLAFHNGNFSMFKGSLPMAGGGSIAFGEWHLFPQQYIMLAALDNFGDTLWTRSYTAGDGLDIQNVHHAGNDLMVVGSYNEAGSDISNVYVMRLDAAGQLLWAKHYPSTRSEWVAGSEIDANSNLYLAVTSEDTATGGASSRLMAVDGLGNFMFGTDLDFDHYDESFSVMHWPGEGLFLGGTRSDGIFGSGTVSRLDFNGNLVWSKSYLPGGYAEPQSISRSGTSDLIVGFVDENTSLSVHFLTMDSSGSLNAFCNATPENPTVTTFTYSPASFAVQILAGCSVDSVILTPLYEAYGREVICLATNSMEPQTAALQLVPNPFHEQAELRVPADQLDQELNLEVWDLQGRAVNVATTQSSSGITIQRGNLPTGIYLYRLSSGNGEIATGKWMID